MKITSTPVLLLCLGLLCLTVHPVLAQNQSPLDIALRHLEQSRTALGLTEADIKHYVVSDLYTSRHNGVTHVYLNQQHVGISINNAITNINILPDGQVLNMGNRFVPDLQSKVNATTPSISAEEALKAVLRKFQDRSNATVLLQEKINDQHYVFDPKNVALEPIPVKLRYEKIDQESIRLVWKVKLYTLNAQNLWNINVDAQTGAILNYHDQVIHCNFDHSNGCAANHSTDQKTLATTPTVFQNQQALSQTSNVYNVFPYPLESPNHGNRELVVNPADPIASPFGWHDTDSIPGPEYTITRGNNVHAYHDIFVLNESLGGEPDGGDSLNFDFPLVLIDSLPYTQIAPAVVNLFYWNNIMHDVWYQYGFTEEAGNFQAHNYGNGGAGEDYVRAEAMDGGGTNNANFSTPEDGSRPRMQMYIWEVEGGLPDRIFDSLVVSAPANLAGTYRMAVAEFGPEISDTFTGQVVLVADTVDVSEDACEDIVNGMEIMGNVAMIDRGDCDFDFKALKAQNEGAIAVIICNTGTGAAYAAPGGALVDSIHIPVVMVNRDDCDTLKTGLPLTVGFKPAVYIIANPGPKGLDSDFDNGVIAHEYTHGISNRLTGGPSADDCLNNFEQAGEGWSDWFALAIQTTESDFAEKSRGIGTYVTNQATDSVGIRDYPYSRDMLLNPHTYAAIDTVSIPHGVGSVWAATIWDLYWNLVDEYGFDDDFYHGTGGNNIAMQLVMDGLKLQACEPNFMDSRNAILDADVANYGGANQCLIWQTFARRGMGLLALPGPVEDFHIPEACKTFMKVDKKAVTETDAGNTIDYTLEIINASADVQTNIAITDAFPEGTALVAGSLDCADATVTDGVLNIQIANMNVGDTMRCSYQLTTQENPFSITIFSDDAEEDIDTKWRSSASLGITKWVVSEGTGRNGSNAFYAEGVASQSDQRLTLRNPIVLNGTHPALSFWHSYDTEIEGDGAVVEIRVASNPQEWIDLGPHILTNGYLSRIKASQTGPLALRPAYNGNSGGYIQTLIDLSAYAGEEATIRFRLACDNVVGIGGWYLDDIRYYDDLFAVTNEICVASDQQDDYCSKAVTILQGEIMDATSDPKEAMTIGIFPNPTKGKILLQMLNPDNGPATLRLQRIDGQVLQYRQLDFSNGTYEMDLSAFAEGIYLLQIQTETSSIIRKVVLQK